MLPQKIETMLRDTLHGDLVIAMKSKNAPAIKALREVKAKITEAETAKGSSTLDDAGILKVIAKVAKEKKESIEQFEKGNRLDLVEAERAELDIITKYLPKQLEYAEVEGILQHIISSNGYAGVRDMGKAIGTFNANYSGQAEGKIVGEIAKRLLS